MKRARIATAIEIQRRKGTAKSVRDVVAAFGGYVAIREWWQTDPPGEPHTFSLVLNLGTLTGELTSAAYVDAIIAEVVRTKPARSHFTFTQAVEAAGRVGVTGFARPMIYARVQATAPAA